MPWAAPKHCAHGHAAFTGAECPVCRRNARARADARRASASARGYDGKWQRESRAFLALPGNAWCACGCGERAEMVDHIRAPKGDMRLFWDRSNWQPMTRACNTRKAIRAEGGFGRPIPPGGGSEL